MHFLFVQLVLILFNVCNAYFDAYRILDKKTIAHGINFAAYAVCVALCIWQFHLQSGFYFGFIPHGEALLLAVSAFFNRQLSFDIPLNLRRKLPWYYQSAANPPKALMDRIERVLFGTGPNVGKEIASIYAALWCICIHVKLWLLWTVN